MSRAPPSPGRGSMTQLLGSNTQPMVHPRHPGPVYLPTQPGPINNPTSQGQAQLWHLDPRGTSVTGRSHPQAGEPAIGPGPDRGVATSFLHLLTGVRPGHLPPTEAQGSLLGGEFPKSSVGSLWIKSSTEFRQLRHCLFLINSLAHAESALSPSRLSQSHTYLRAWTASSHAKYKSRFKPGVQDEPVVSA